MAFQDDGETRDAALSHRSVEDRTRLRVAQGRAVSKAMNTPSASSREWARRLLAVESSKHFASNQLNSNQSSSEQPASETQMQEAVRVSEKLSVALTRFVGADGFAALLRRAVALARADVPALQQVRVAPNGRLEGLNEFAVDAGTDLEAATAITAHLLELLVNFIGESLTLRLLRNAWPEEALEE